MIEERDLTPERRVSLYLTIARRIRKYPYARAARRAAVEQAWEARRELRQSEGGER